MRACTARPARRQPATLNALNSLCAAVPNSVLLSCANTIPYLGTSTVCALAPLLNGVSVFAFRSDLALSASPSGATSGALINYSPDYGTNFTFNYTANGTVSQQVVLVVSTGGTALANLTITVLAVPTRVNTTCPSATVAVGTNMTCTLLPLNAAGAVVFTQAINIPVANSPGVTIVQPTPAVAASFTLVITGAGPTGPATVNSSLPGLALSLIVTGTRSVLPSALRRSDA